MDVPYRVVEVCWVLPRSHVYYTCRRLVRRGRPSRLALSSFGDGKLQVENVSLSQIAVAAANPGVSEMHTKFDLQSLLNYNTKHPIRELLSSADVTNIGLVVTSINLKLVAKILR